MQIDVAKCYVEPSGHLARRRLPRKNDECSNKERANNSSCSAAVLQIQSRENTLQHRQSDPTTEKNKVISTHANDHVTILIHSNAIVLTNSERNFTPTHPRTRHKDTLSRAPHTQSSTEPNTNACRARLTHTVLLSPTPTHDKGTPASNSLSAAMVSRFKPRATDQASGAHGGAPSSSGRQMGPRLG
mmetsp:Transcript_35155/g.85412  ORF Transcript_35155/g.85412 Transcript_35155/m.85412 type:complete len:187 (+) Transcript_35155:224-784(+)